MITFRHLALTQFFTRLQVAMAQLAGFLELYLISNYLSHLQLQQYLWELEITFHLLLAGYGSVAETADSLDFVKYIFM